MHLRQQTNTIYGNIMAAYGQSFESTNNIEARKEFKRKAREQVLCEAKEKYEREEKRKELKRERGEDTWMLPEVDRRLQQLDQEHSGKSKKKKEKKSKKSKKEKKKKDKKEKKSAKEDDSSDSSEDLEGEWVEAPAHPDVSQKAWKIQDQKNPSTASPTSASKRDEWMTFDFLAMKTTSTEERRAEKEKQKEAEREKARCIEEAGLHKLELNPFWKDGGTGLPPQESAVAPIKKAAVVDDGGLSWLRKSYQRMREQAEREQRSLEAVVAERYGSMEQFQKRLQEAENAAFGRRKAQREFGGDRWRRGGPQGPQRSFGGDAEASPPGGEHAERERGRADGRGARRDGHVDRGRDSRYHRGGDRLRDGRPEDSERGRREDRGRSHEDRPRRESPHRGRSHDDPPCRECPHRGRSHDDPPRRESPHRGRSQDDPPRRESPHRGRSHEDPPRRESPHRGRSHDDPPRRESPRRGRSHDDPPRRESPRRGRSHDDPPRRESPHRGRSREDAPRRESPQGVQRRDRSPPALGSLRAKFLKPTAIEEDTWTGWARKSEAAPTSASSGFLRPSDDDGEAKLSGTPAWKKPSFREPDPEGAPEQAPQPELKHCRGGHTSPQQQPDREANTALQESHSHSHRSTATPPRSSSGPAQASESEEEEEEDVQILSDEEMNKLGAKLVKAELMGNTALVEKLKAQLESARKAKESRAQKGPASVPNSKVSGRVEEDQEVVLFRTDQAGRAWPVNAPSEPLEPRGGRRKKKAMETHRDGERVRYFQDDDGTDLREMVRREKMTTSEDQNALYSRMAAKMMGKQDGDNYTLDDMFVSSAAQRERSGQEEERQRSRAIQEHQRWASCMQKCPYCFDSPELPKHLVIAIGAKVYLCLPNCVSLAEGHCLIAPLHHHCAATGLDEDVWAEIQMFRKALVKMFQDQDQDCVFLETHRNPKNRRHMVYECIPLPRELGDMAPIYFKKALMESDEEWAMNKKVVDLSSRDIRRAIPKGLPYFSVDFGLQGGFAHVIENEQKFPHYFGKEIIGGMLDLEPRRWRKPIRENFDDQRKKVLEFAQWWKPFDCTKAAS
ncbi:CWF19-like protein 2 isoform X2 [Anguilla anguilla]|uniref:CWF19-like protein 2 isoform X2 n=1 Tax=Anguilla anguilla TaxID=7936 RepID=UPI0015B32F98|nr:CWF19-like protein 2 isoform X2 [Anguilla anguilla]